MGTIHSFDPAQISQIQTQQTTGPASTSGRIKVNDSGNERESKTDATAQAVFHKAASSNSTEKSFKATSSSLLEKTHGKQGAETLTKLFGTKAEDEIKSLYGRDSKEVVQKLYSEDAVSYAPEVKENLTAILSAQAEIPHEDDVEQDEALRMTQPGTFVIKGTNPPGGVTVRTFIGEQPSGDAFVDEVFHPPLEAATEKIYTLMTTSEPRTVDVDGQQVTASFTRYVPYSSEYVIG